MSAKIGYSIHLAETATPAERRVTVVLLSADGLALAAVAALVDLGSVSGAGNGCVGAGCQGEDSDDVEELHFGGFWVVAVLAGRELKLISV